jgi:hypothetical protein
MIANPIPASIVLVLPRSPTVTRVSGSATTTPAFSSAMMPSRKPIPAAIAVRCERGIASMIQARIGRTLTMKNSTPEMNTAPSATCQL